MMKITLLIKKAKLSLIVRKVKFEKKSTLYSMLFSNRSEFEEVAQKAKNIYILESLNEKENMVRQVKFFKVYWFVDSYNKVK